MTKKVASKHSILPLHCKYTLKETSEKDIIEDTIDAMITPLNKEVYLLGILILTLLLLLITAYPPEYGPSKNHRADIIISDLDI
jgi:hypothetical protein